MLQYLINGDNASAIITIVIDAINNGCRWIRLDISNLPSDNEVHNVVDEVMKCCNEHEAFFSIENDVDKAKAFKTLGLHLSSDQLPNLVDIRKTLGEEPVIGVTVDAPAQVPFLPRTAIDYISTNGNDLENCNKISWLMRESNLDEPVVATFEPGMSIDMIMSTGVDGIVVDSNSYRPADLKNLIAEVKATIEQRLSNI